MTAYGIACWVAVQGKVTPTLHSRLIQQRGTSGGGDVSEGESLRSWSGLGGSTVAQSGRFVRRLGVVDVSLAFYLNILFLRRKDIGGGSSSNL